MSFRRRRFFGWFAGGLLTLAVASAAELVLPAAEQIRTAFGALDSSRNEAIDNAEWQAATDALFRAADRNGDVFIDGDELAAGAIAQDTFLRANLDGDTRLSRSEFSELRRALFRTADIDRNGFLAPVEFELFVLMQHVGWTDANRNSRIELSELAAALAKAFAALDADGDSALSPAEAAYLRPAALARYDADGDGRLGRDEFVGGYRSELLDG